MAGVAQPGVVGGEDFWKEVGPQLCRVVRAQLGKRVEADILRGPRMITFSKPEMPST